MGKRNNKNNTNTKGVRNMTTAMVRANIVAIPRPPQYDANLCFTKKFRFVSTSPAGSTAFTITPAKLGFLISMATALNTVTQFISSVKIIKVEIWDSPPQTLIPNTCSITFFGSDAGLAGDQKVRASTSSGATVVAHVKAKPNAFIPAAHFQSTLVTGLGIESLFSFTINQGAIIDLTLACAIDPGIIIANRGTNSLTTVNTLGVGQIYYMALDNNAGASFSGSSLILPDADLRTTS